MAQVLQMRQELTGSIDQSVIGRLEHMLGAQRSREVIEDACFEIVERLTRFEVSIASLTLLEARRLARSVAAISSEIGMADLGAAARAAAACLDGDDTVARMATAQRLLRVGEASLDALMSRQNGSTG